jgi:hypothetical protein
MFDMDRGLALGDQNAGDYIISEDVGCPCLGIKSLELSEMLSCIGCAKLQHKACVDEDSQDDAERDEYFCNHCDPQLSRRLIDRVVQPIDTTPLLSSMQIASIEKIRHSCPFASAFQPLLRLEEVQQVRGSGLRYLITGRDINDLKRLDSSADLSNLADFFRSLTNFNGSFKSEGPQCLANSPKNFCLPRLQSTQASSRRDSATCIFTIPMSSSSYRSSLIGLILERPPQSRPSSRNSRDNSEIVKELNLICRWTLANASCPIRPEVTIVH